MIWCSSSGERMARLSRNYRAWPLAPMDGLAGAQSRAVRDYQKANGLVADGIAGPTTLAHLSLGLPAGTSNEAR